MGELIDARYERLAPWVKEPTLAKPALEWIEARERPHTAREIAEGIGVRPHMLTSVLQRLGKRGLIRRWQTVMDYPHNRFPGRTIKRKTWLHQRIEPKE